MQHDFLLLDRSGSMQGSMWTEALGAINGYVKKLAEDNVDTGVTLAVFDSNEPFVVIRDRITPKTWREVSDADATPRGMTPLNDGVGKLLDLADKGAPDGKPYEKVAIIIMTDGHENASTEYTVAKIKSRLDSVRAKGWQVIFLGANFDNAAQAMSYGTAAHNTVSSSVRNMGATMMATAGKRSAFASGAVADMAYSSEEKKRFAEQ